MITLALTDNQVMDMVEQLPEDNIKALYEKLKQKLFVKHVDAFVEEVEANKKIYPITDEEIEAEVEQAREELYKNRN